MRLISLAICIGIFAAIFGAPPAAEAQARFTVKHLHDLCASQQVQRQNVCSAYIAGVRQTMDVFKGSLKARVRYCIPPRVTTRDVKEKFVAWAERNAASSSGPAVAGLMRSIHEAYACGAPGGEKFEF